MTYASGDIKNSTTAAVSEAVTGQLQNYIQIQHCEEMEAQLIHKKVVSFRIEYAVSSSASSTTNRENGFKQNALAAGASLANAMKSMSFASSAYTIHINDQLTECDDEVPFVDPNLAFASLMLVPPEEAAGAAPGLPPPISFNPPSLEQTSQQIRPELVQRTLLPLLLAAPERTEIPPELYSPVISEFPSEFDSPLRASPAITPTAGSHVDVRTVSNSSIGGASPSNSKSPLAADALERTATKSPRSSEIIAHSSSALLPPLAKSPNPSTAAIHDTHSQPPCMSSRKSSLAPSLAPSSNRSSRINTHSPIDPSSQFNRSASKISFTGGSSVPGDASTEQSSPTATSITESPVTEKFIIAAHNPHNIYHAACLFNKAKAYRCPRSGKELIAPLCTFLVAAMAMLKEPKSVKNICNFANSHRSVFPLPLFPHAYEEQYAHDYLRQNNAPPPLDPRHYDNSPSQAGTFRGSDATTEGSNGMDETGFWSDNLVQELCTLRRLLLAALEGPMEIRQLEAILTRTPSFLRTTEVIAIMERQRVLSAADRELGIAIGKENAADLAVALSHARTVQLSDIKLTLAQGKLEEYAIELQLAENAVKSSMNNDTGSENGDGAESHGSRSTYSDEICEVNGNPRSPCKKKVASQLASDRQIAFNLEERQKEIWLLNEYCRSCLRQS